MATAVSAGLFQWASTLPLPAAPRFLHVGAHLTDGCRPPMAVSCEPSRAVSVVTAAAGTHFTGWASAGLTPAWLPPEPPSPLLSGYPWATKASGLDTVEGALGFSGERRTSQAPTDGAETGTVRWSGGWGTRAAPSHHRPGISSAWEPADGTLRSLKPRPRRLPSQEGVSTPSAPEPPPVVTGPHGVGHLLGLAQLVLKSLCWASRLRDTGAEVQVQVHGNCRHRAGGRAMSGASLTKGLNCKPPSKNIHRCLARGTLLQDPPASPNIEATLLKWPPVPRAGGEVPLVQPSLQLPAGLHASPGQGLPWSHL
ncbi:PREDICTED: uncharacterized protein LOC105596808 [Cercocebus atys]|uniref:uncharacterized protein LOC105596808 n=1 Tax=Cercocebus atys TaxID=9531 RepID=UPI0005F48572|nr:PREDICTED: uncharacterized protein LOC105596808 [Cercocebus atys]